MSETHNKPQDTPTRLLAAAALILVLIVGGLSVHASQSRHTRDRAYQQITAAAAENDYEAVLQSVETFVANPSFPDTDGRRPEVLRLGRQALAHWFASRGHVGAQTLAQIDRYRFLADFQDE